MVYFIRFVNVSKGGLAEVPGILEDIHHRRYNFQVQRNSSLQSRYILWLCISACSYYRYSPSARRWYPSCRGVPRLDSTREKKQVGRPPVRTEGFSGANILYWRNDLRQCWDFSAPPSDSAPGALWSLCPSRFALTFSCSIHKWFLYIFQHSCIQWLRRWSTSHINLTLSWRWCLKKTPQIKQMQVRNNHVHSRIRKYPFLPQKQPVKSRKNTASPCSGSDLFVCLASEIESGWIQFELNQWSPKVVQLHQSGYHLQI